MVSWQHPHVGLGCWQSCLLTFVCRLTTSLQCPIILKIDYKMLSEQIKTKHKIPLADCCSLANVLTHYFVMENTNGQIIAQTGLRSMFLRPWKNEMKWFEFSNRAIETHSVITTNQRNRLLMPCLCGTPVCGITFTNSIWEFVLVANQHKITSPIMHMNGLCYVCNLKNMQALTNTRMECDNWKHAANERHGNGSDVPETHSQNTFCMFCMHYVFCVCFYLKTLVYTFAQYGLFANDSICSKKTHTFQHDSTQHK